MLEILKANRFSFSLLLLLLVLPFAFSSGLIYYIIQNEESISSFTLPQWFLFYSISVFTMAAGFTHTTLISMISGYFLGWECIPFILSSYLLACLAGYYLGTLIDHGKFLSSLSNLNSVKQIIEGLKKNEFAIIFFSRLSPALPFAITNLLFALIKVNIKSFLIAGFAGMLPRTLLFIWIGTQAHYIKNLLTGKEKTEVSTIFGIVLIVVSVAGLFYFVTRAIKPSKSTSEKNTYF